MYGLEPTQGVAYSAYMPILEAAFSGSGSGSPTTTSKTTTSTRTTSTATTTRTSTSSTPGASCVARYAQCGVSRGSSIIGLRVTNEKIGQRLDRLYLLPKRVNLQGKQ